MIHISIPGAGVKQISHVVFDYNGTIAEDGILIPGVKDILDVFGFLKTPERFKATLRQ